MPPSPNWDGLPVGRHFYVYVDEEFNDNIEKSLWLLVNSKFKMAAFETSKNHIN